MTRIYSWEYGISTDSNVFLKQATLEKSDWWDILTLIYSRCTCLNELLDPAIEEEEWTGKQVGVCR